MFVGDTQCHPLGWDRRKWRLGDEGGLLVTQSHSGVELVASSPSPQEPMATLGREGTLAGPERGAHNWGRSRPAQRPLGKA